MLVAQIWDNNNPHVPSARNARLLTPANCCIRNACSYHGMVFNIRSFYSSIYHMIYLEFDASVGVNISMFSKISLTYFEAHGFYLDVWLNNSRTPRCHILFWSEWTPSILVWKKNHHGHQNVKLWAHANQQNPNNWWHMNKYFWKKNRFSMV